MSWLRTLHAESARGTAKRSRRPPYRGLSVLFPESMAFPNAVQTKMTPLHAQNPSQVASIQMKNLFSSVPATRCLGDPSEFLPSRKRATTMGIASRRDTGTVHTVNCFNELHLPIDVLNLCSNMGSMLLILIDQQMMGSRPLSCLPVCF